MNREIKFRAWDTQDKEMWDWEEHDREICWHLSGECSYDIILMQYTGLKSKSGVEIYEGDIFKHKKNIFMQVFWSGDKAGWGVKYVLYGSDRGNQNFYKSLIWASKTCEIIGNIYENPELL